MIEFTLEDESWVVLICGIVIGALATMFLVIFLTLGSGVQLKAGFAEYPNRNLVCAINDDNQILSCFDNATVVADDE